MLYIIIIDDCTVLASKVRYAGVWSLHPSLSPSFLIVRLCTFSVHIWCTGEVPATGVESRFVIRLINECEVVIVLPCFNRLLCIDVVISPAL